MISKIYKRHARRFGAVLIALSIAACEYTPDLEEEEVTFENQETLFGEGGLANLFGSETDTGTGIGVNSFLWRASLETISFMPVSTADAFGGLIITDWYSPPESPRERFKLNVYILGRTLRADGVKVSVFRQVRDRTGNWADATTPQETGTKIEDSILTKARMLRHQTLVSQQ